MSSALASSDLNFTLATALPIGAAPEYPVCNSHTFKDKPTIQIFRKLYNPGFLETNMAS